MLEEIKESYKKACVFNRECNPVFTFRTYPSGAKQCRTQCDACGLTLGYSYSKKKIEASYPIKPFDEEQLKKCHDDWMRVMQQSTNVQMRLNTIAAALRRDYFLNQLEIDYDEFGDAYQQYIASPQWKQKRKSILQRDKYTCLVCQQNGATEVHHMSYRNLGNESDFELLSVCRDCHKEIHGYKVDNIGLDSIFRKPY